MVVIGSLCSLAVGVSFPINLIIFSNVVNGFTNSTDGSGALATMDENSKWFIILGAVSLVLAFIQMFCFSLAANRQSRRIRLQLFKQMLRQDMAWFDRQSVGDLITKITSNLEQIESGIGDRLSRFLQNFIMFISCFVTAFVNGWKLTLVGISTAPFIVLAFSLMGVSLGRFAIKENQAYSGANSIASEVLTAIRTVFAFIGQEKEAKRYSSELGAAAKVSMKKNAVLGFSIGLITLSVFASSGLTFWFGVKELPTDPDLNSGKIVSVVLAFLVGSIGLGLVLPEFAFFTRAASAARSVFHIIERVPEIDKEAEGRILDEVRGKIEFKNVSFAYPMRPDVVTLRDFSLKVQPGQTIAIVGPSGSGKSTSVQLLQRFYDALQGEVLIDGVDIRELDIKWYRSQLGVVSQEPVLFCGTVAENIALGRPGATQEDIEKAAKMADVHDFILSLPKAYDTPIAEGGGSMSGGQKQRIAIARALIRNPKILLLDEATSALDTRSERAVQTALDRARTGRTVIMIAHRLTTVRDADKILVVDRGEVKEKGTHEELVALNGIYAHMLSTQEKGKSDESESEPGSDYEEEVGGILSKEELARQHVWMRSKRAKETESVVSAATDSTLAEARTETFTIQDYDQKLAKTSFLAGMMALVGFFKLLCTFFSALCLGIAGARLTKRVRAMLFEAMLKQEAGWFDRMENQPGILTARLATEVSSLELVTGSQLGSMLEAVCLVIAALVIAFVYSWALALVNIAFMPIIVGASAFQMKHNRAAFSQHEVMGSQVVQEALSAERTVFSLGLENHFYQLFKERSAPSASQRYKDSALLALVHCFANSIAYFQTTASFYVGAVLMSKGQLDVLAVFRAYSAFNFGSQALARVAALAPDYQKALVKIRKVFSTIDRETKMDVLDGLYPETDFKGKIEFRNVYFRYPTRKDVRILRRFNHTVSPGESVALVGQSGCGKSTLLQLVQRLYDVSPHGPDSGVFLDGMDVRILAPNWIRQQIGIVSQEPNLFDMTIQENIAYGDNSREVEMSEIIDAAKKANVHDFVMSLPEGYETKVGARGSQLSGGQKQRVAIARALVRNPRLLLLDEATSALDNESERIVQAALDAAMAEGNRTSLIVAHRLTTVENCSFIVVLQDGQKVECGPPDALMRAKGVYYTLHNVDAAVKRH
ncbi:unnamed protein product [Schistocephalus solidus]|uniref:Multidrug resistance protein 1 n=1 Tax=Schistocephalus solidus TaxID=70667 RepID=A0A183SHG4_SCHSO|nr:unnamed protein product [Schistocephalus solidus]